MGVWVRGWVSGWVGVLLHVLSVLSRWMFGCMGERVCGWCLPIMQGMRRLCQAGGWMAERRNDSKPCGMTSSIRWHAFCLLLGFNAIGYELGLLLGRASFVLGTVHAFRLNLFGFFA